MNLSLYKIEINKNQNRLYIFFVYYINKIFWVLWKKNLQIQTKNEKFFFIKKKVKKNEQ